MFHMSNDSDLFRTRTELEADGWELQGNHFVRGDDRYLPLYEAKMIHHFDHRWATYDGDEVRAVSVAEKQDPAFSVLPRVLGTVPRKCTQRAPGAGWLLASEFANHDQRRADADRWTSSFGGRWSTALR